MRWSEPLQEYPLTTWNEINPRAKRIKNEHRLLITAPRRTANSEYRTKRIVGTKSDLYHSKIATPNESANAYLEVTSHISNSQCNAIYEPRKQKKERAKPDASSRQRGEKGIWIFFDDVPRFHTPEARPSISRTDELRFLIAYCSFTSCSQSIRIY